MQKGSRLCTAKAGARRKQAMSQQAMELLAAARRIELRRAVRRSVAAWQAFAKTLRRLIRDGIHLRKRPDFATEKYRGRIRRIG